MNWKETLITAVIGAAMIASMPVAFYARPHIKAWVDSVASDRKPIESTTSVKVFIDPDTGCHYLVRDGFVTPRLSGDGRQVCAL